MSENALHTPEGAKSALAREYFGGWYPLSQDGLDALAPEIQEIAHYAQRCLIQRNEKQLTEALAQIRAWRKARPELTTRRQSPDVVLDEDLGSHLEIGTFVDLLLTQPALALKAHEYTALAALKEISGLCELEAVAGKGAISSAAQHLTLKLAWLQTATILLRMADHYPGQRETLRAMMQKMFRSSEAVL
ncbi:MAG: hypothetical protein EBV03_00560 [Proteobacteria bacterium]|nr:hypothetical protein [Pseudomonadota bacterium]